MTSINLLAQPDASQISILVTASERAQQAEKVARKLGVPVTTDSSIAQNARTTLQFGENGVALIGGNMRLQPDFSTLRHRLRPDRLSGELLVKAAKVKQAGLVPRAIDATAGLGEDAFLLAAAGFFVDLYESNPAIAVLLQDALSRAQQQADLAPVATRMTLHEQDSIPALRALTFRPDVILLDPMFPLRKSSAAVKKKFQLLHVLEKPCNNAKELLQAALDANPRKIIIKRPLRGSYLAGIKPNYSLEGKTVRFDCIVLPARK